MDLHRRATPATSDAISDRPMPDHPNVILLSTKDLDIERPLLDNERQRLCDDPSTKDLNDGRPLLGDKRWVCSAMDDGLCSTIHQ